MFTCQLSLISYMIKYIVMSNLSTKNYIESNKVSKDIKLLTDSIAVKFDAS